MDANYSFEFIISRYQNNFMLCFEYVVPFVHFETPWYISTTEILILIYWQQILGSVPDSAIKHQNMGLKSITLLHAERDKNHHKILLPISILWVLACTVYLKLPSVQANSAVDLCPVPTTRQWAIFSSFFTIDQLLFENQIIILLGALFWHFTLRWVLSVVSGVPWSQQCQLFSVKVVRVSTRQHWSP